MDLLPLIINKKKKGTFRQLKRSDRIALYEQYIDDQLRAFEVFLIKKHNGFTFPNGKVKEPGEAYPRDEDFGLTAWSIGISQSKEISLQRANDKFEQLKQHYETVHPDSYK